MTGTAETEAGEFASTYNLPVVPIPTNKPLVRDDEPDLIFKTEEAKFNAVVDDLVERQETGPAGAGRHGLGGQVRAAVPPAGEARHPPPGPQRQAALPGGRGGGPGRPARRRHRGHQHGRPWGRHHPRRQRRDAGPPRGGGPGRRPRDRRGPGRARAAHRRLRGDAAPRRASRCASSAASTCSAASATRAAASTTSSGAGRAARATRARAGSTCSLEDELMRLFATGAMSWVMGRALPDDVPIEAKMVTKAIERAQNTVEGRNSEIRKDVLKYDEVMNEQRKVIYARRLQVIDGEDLHEHTDRAARARPSTPSSRRRCPSDFSEEWDLERTGDRGHAVLPDPVHRRRPGRGDDHRAR